MTDAVLEALGERRRTHPPDPARQARGRSARRRGNDFEREVAHELGLRRVGQFGGKDDVRGDWASIQCKVGGAFSERYWAWLHAIPHDAMQLPLLVIGDAPGSGGRRRRLVVIDFDDFERWYGRG
jgi:hypothetical protein